MASYDPLLVLLSFGVSVFGSFTALQVARHIPRRGSDRLFWIGNAAFAMGAGAIWSMHFIGMLALEAGMPVRYDVPLTAGSLLLAVAGAGAGFALVGETRSRLMAASLLMGGGIAGMHYVGMAAMIMPASLSYRTGWVAASVVTGVGASAASLRLATRSRGPSQSAASAFVMGFAVCGMHYLGMAAARFEPSGQVVSGNPQVSPDVLAYAVFLVSVVLLSVQVGLVAGSRVTEPVSEV